MPTATPRGKAAILADNRNLTLADATVDGAPALELKLTPQQIKERQDYAVQQNIVILRNRLNSPELAVSEPQVARQGVDRIAIQLPGLQNSAEVKKILGKTATLEFRMVDEANSPLEAAATGRVPLGLQALLHPRQAAGAAEARGRGHRRSADGCVVSSRIPRTAPPCR